MVVVAGAKGAAGVTTAATALAAVWPATAILADCDPSGGDLAMRLRREDGGWLARDCGVVGLAASIQAQSGHREVVGQLQTAVGGVPVLVGVDSPAQAVRIGEMWAEIADLLTRVPSMDVIADCGRLLPGLPNQQFVARADALLLVTGAGLEAVAHLRHLLEALDASQRSASSVHVAVIADTDTSRRDVDAVTSALHRAGHADVAVHTLARDASAAAGLAGVPTRGLDRSALVSSARALAGELYDAVRSSRGSSVDSSGPVDALPVEVG